MNVNLRPADHVCHLFTSDAEQKSLTLTLLKNGLMAGEYGLHISSRGQLDDWYFELQANGVDVAGERARGALEVLSAQDFYRDLETSSVGMAREFWQIISSPLKRFSGIWIVSDMRWTQESGLKPDRLCHWEASANVLFEDTNARVICQYDSLHQTPSEILAALRTHPQVILDGKLRLNPNYEGPKILANEPLLNYREADDELIRHLLAALR